MVEKGLLVDGGMLVVEHAQRKDWPETLGGLAQLMSRRYGDTRITLYRQSEDGERED